MNAVGIILAGFTAGLFVMCVLDMYKRALNKFR